ncbi:MAG TPA: hypothetical protein VKC89_00155 [Patescibacteria group bacterium]|nr:hypothetical protein [Patescibacteria group bacterium]
MCYNCGCFNPNDNMGSDDNITNSTFDKLTKKWNKDSKATARNLLEGNKVDENPDLKEIFEKAANTWGQSVGEAKSNALKLLKTSK